MQPVFLFRSEPGLSKTLERFVASGLEADGCPLFESEPLDWTVPDPSAFDGLLVGSANAFRHGGEGLSVLSSLPVLAVGDATAVASREVGFVVEQTGTAGLQQLLDTLAVRHHALLRLAGDVRVDVVPPAGVWVETRVVYRMRPLPMAQRIADRMRAEGGVVLLHSGEAARRLSAECDRLGIERARLTIAALSARIAASVGEGWRSVHIADHPSDAELLALAQRLCQGSSPGSHH